MGGDRDGLAADLNGVRLKSAPPVWAGTVYSLKKAGLSRLKSAPPVWAGTNRLIKAFSNTST